MRIAGITGTDLFKGKPSRPLQVVRVTVAGPSLEPVTVRVEGPAVTTVEPVRLPPLRAGSERVAEVGVALAEPVTEGSPRRVVAMATGSGGGARAEGEIRAAVPGWTMWMVSHFHYDPVWWNTQAGYTQTWYDVPAADEPRPKTTVFTAFDLVRAHLEAARRDHDYKFVLAEVDYLKPHWDSCPEDRADLRRFLDEGRIEIVGGNYNEPNTNLTHPETTVRNAVYGMAYQREVIGGDPRSAWMLDVFGHDPAYPGLMADAGLDSSAWARGPFHQWGPNRHVGDNRLMQFPSEFEWISPDGRGLLTHYMANHYSTGWAMDHQASSTDEALKVAYEQFAELAPVAATRNVMLPVGGDHVVPSRWCTEIHRQWPYLWPRFTVGLPRDFFAAVRAELGRSRRRPSPQTRDMNPVYTGKDVSFIDTKQAHRAAEVAVLDAERLATLASLRGAAYPREALDKAWRLLVYLAHHDALTGTESDQVYLDLLGNWREAHDLGDMIRRSAAAHLAAQADTRGPGVPVSVFNTLSWARTDVVTIRVTFPEGHQGFTLMAGPSSVPAVADGVVRRADGSLAEATITFLARDVPALGYRIFHLIAAPDLPCWTAEPGTTISGEAFTLTADGPALTSIRDNRTGRELLREGGLGGVPYLQEEYDKHPEWGEGPWHLLPKGPGVLPQTGTVRAEASPLGRRLIIETALGGLTLTQEVLLWKGVDRVDFRLHADGSIGRDRLLRTRFDFDLPGTRPVYETGYAAIGRSFGHPNADAAQMLWAQDNPALNWAGLSSAVRLDLGDTQLAVGVAEVVAPDGVDVRPLLAALAACGVTATSGVPEGPRYGRLDLDSNLPDTRIVIGGPDHNTLAAEILHGHDTHALELARTGRTLVPASTPAGARTDVRGPHALPALIITDPDALAADLDDAVIEVRQRTPHLPEVAGSLTPYSVALINRGTPGFVAEPDGTAYMALMRACTGWPSGIWLDGERRTAPDGSDFGWQHWSHTFAYSLVSGPGDWRDAGFVHAGHEVNHPMLAGEPGTHDGELPPRLSLASVSPDSAVLTALKQDNSGDVVFRFYEPHGRATTARPALHGGIAAAYRANILEERDGDERAEVDLAAAQVATVTVVPAARRTGNVVIAPQAEPVQPVHTRYWLHDKGPAPLGDLPTAVHLSPSPVRLAPGEQGALRLTVASSTHHAHGTVELDVPHGLKVEAPELRYDLAPGEWAEFALTVRGEQGARHLAARIRDELGQILEDTAEILIEAEPVTLTAELWTEPSNARPSGPELALRPGERGELVLRLATSADARVRGEVQLLSPFGTWELIPDWTRAFAIEPGGRTELHFTMTAPHDLRPGSHSWVLAKIGWFGRLTYTPAVPVTIVWNSDSTPRHPPNGRQ
ncbi:glycosyl hydrolase-related protein [Nonomuraea sp. NPDC059007]|uniref:glycoside hydrolase family 38 N-terminal domain-containing protein n=1 Tax=Nonomuraea sp. NPDC059007 TaxID=3346692 RepID=UPI0036C244CE